MNLSSSCDPEDMLFAILNNLPLGTLTSIVAMFSIVIFFVTSADSASIVMGSMSQRGMPNPTRLVAITWGVLLGTVATCLLLAGGEDAADGLESIMVAPCLPVALIVMGILLPWD